MSRIKNRDSKAEMVVRRMVHGMGYRYRLHSKKLPGKPDLVFASRKKVIFVHGCFWHRHDCPRGQSLPKSHTEYWLPKLQRNKERDAEVQNKLRELGWDYLVLWECMIKDKDQLREKLLSFLAEASNG